MGRIEKNATTRNQMKFLIAGDSWGLGEWDTIDEKYQVVHSGLAMYLTELGHSVLNLSCGGISNFDIVGRIEGWLSRFPEQVPDKILVFQTEYTRDYKHRDLNIDDFDVEQFSDISSRWISRFYTRLSELSVQYTCPVYIIGGTSDTMWFDDMSAHYPGCQVICQSLTNLLINDDHRISQPVDSWYTNQSYDFVAHARRQSFDISDIVAAITLGFDRERAVAERPDFFYPDGVHPNRKGHKILFDFLREQHII